MPYLPEHRRRVFEDNPFMMPKTPGELNYLITRICLRYLRHGQLSYERLNAVIGALESAKLEMYARQVRPYEDKKIGENGDVY